MLSVASVAMKRKETRPILQAKAYGLMRSILGSCKPSRSLAKESGAEYLNLLEQGRAARSNHTSKSSLPNYQRTKNQLTNISQLELPGSTIEKLKLNLKIKNKLKKELLNKKVKVFKIKPKFKIKKQKFKINHQISL